MASVKTIAQKLNAWRRYRQTIRELSQLNDYELGDVGVHRSEIENIARRTATV